MAQYSSKHNQDRQSVTDYKKHKNVHNLQPRHRNHHQSYGILAIVVSAVLCIAIAVVTVAIFLETNTKIHPSEEPEVILQTALSGGKEVRITDSSGNPVESLAGGQSSQAIMNAITFKIKSIERQDDTLNATVIFFTPDITTLALEYADLKEPEHDFLAWIKERLEMPYPTKEMEIQVQFVCDDSGLTLVADHSLYNVLTGGALEYVAQQQKMAYDKLVGVH